MLPLTWLPFVTQWKKKKKGSCCKYQSFLPRLTRVTVSAIWDILNLAIPVDVLQLRCDLYTLRDMLKSFSKCAVPCFHAICATLHWKVYCHHLLGWYLQVKAPPGFFCFFSGPFQFQLPRSGTTRGTLTLQCLFGTKCFQGCTTTGTCKCLVCALLLWGVHFFAASIDGNVYEFISPVVVLSLFAAQACVVALVCVS